MTENERISMRIDLEREEAGVKVRGPELQNNINMTYADSKGKDTKAPVSCDTSNLSVAEGAAVASSLRPAQT